jgi:hypothetical protein
MGVKNFERLVIDASIARSAGESINPTSSNCRIFLETVMQEGYLLVMTREIKQEWDKHQSRFARTWLLSMVAKKKFLPITPGDYSSLWEKLDKMVFGNEQVTLDIRYQDNQRKAVIKDIHLLEAAFESDRCIFSLDDKMRSLLQQAIECCPEIAGIIWANPDRDEEKIVVWLQSGMPDSKSRYLHI